MPLVFNFLLLLVTTYFAFRTRKVPHNFNKAKFISFTVYTLCILWLAFIPTYFAAASVLGSIYESGSLMLAIILSATVTLCILFLPKVYRLSFAKLRSNPTSGRTTAAGHTEGSSSVQNFNWSVSTAVKLRINTTTSINLSKGEEVSLLASMLLMMWEWGAKICKQSYKHFDFDDDTQLDYNIASLV